MNKTLFAREAKANYKLLLIFMGVLSLYSLMIIMMFDPDLGESLEAMAKSMPQIFAAFGMLNAGATLTDFLANYLYGFLLVVFPLVFIIILSGRLISRYVDRGTMAYLLATPVPRLRIALTQAIVLLASLLCLTVYVTLLCIVSSELLFPNELDIGKFILLNAGQYGLMVFLCGICFCSACLFNDNKKAMGIGAGMPIAFILIQMLSQVGDKFDWLQYCTPLTLFDPMRIIAGEASAVGLFAILYGFGLVLFAVGITVFCKKDMPV